MEGAGVPERVQEGGIASCLPSPIVPDVEEGTEGEAPVVRQLVVKDLPEVLSAS
jgi:hypothetical protein